MGYHPLCSNSDNYHYPAAANNNYYTIPFYSSDPAGKATTNNYYYSSAVSYLKSYCKANSSSSVTLFPWSQPSGPHSRCTVLSLYSVGGSKEGRGSAVTLYYYPATAMDGNCFYTHLHIRGKVYRTCIIDTAHTHYPFIPLIQPATGTVYFLGRNDLVVSTVNITAYSNAVQL